MGSMTFLHREVVPILRHAAPAMEGLGAGSVDRSKLLLLVKTGKRLPHLVLDLHARRDRRTGFDETLPAETEPRIASWMPPGKLVANGAERAIVTTLASALAALLLVVLGRPPALALAVAVALLAFGLLLDLRLAWRAEQRRRQALEHELKRRDAFWSSAAHDLRSQVSALKLRAQLLATKAAQLRLDRAEPLVRGLNEMRSQINLVTAAITELQDISQLDMGVGLKLNLEPTDLVDVGRQVVADVCLLSNRDISLESPLPALVGQWDATRLRRVLMNLLDNAVKFSPAGGRIQVSISRQRQAGGMWARLAVTDNGMGIPSEELPSIFQRFHRARNVEGVIRGTGLGLAGASAIVEQHGGTIAVQSTEAAGTSVIVSLPIAAEPN